MTYYLGINGTKRWGAPLHDSAAGCAIISTVDIGQMHRSIEPKTTSKLVDNLKFYIDNPNQALREGKQNRKIAKKFTWKKYFNGLEKLYSKTKSFQGVFE